ncbi:hypothetical protein RUM43_009596 [Polyplax serrata]|uniref:Uncharacterized protein n=1 Tax=Polyplax serrata TaxID=468196 RepID=A0AAN8PAZ4_POLSC
MLCPEIWNFAVPKSAVTTKACTSENLIKVIEKQLINHHVSITVPNAIGISKEITNILVEDSQYYRINNIPAYELINKDFIDLFIRNGQLTAISVNSHFNQEDHLTFIPNGKFILTLSRNTIQQIGLESIKLPKHAESLIILDALSLASSVKRWNEIHNKLSLVDLLFDIILIWTPNDKKVCPSSIALYFSQKSYEVKTCDVTVEKKVSYNVKVPVYDTDTDGQALLEWLGAFNLQCNLSDNNPYISSFTCLEKMETYGQVCHNTFTGLFTLCRIKKLIKEILSFVDSKPSSWVSLVIHGFEGGLLSIKSGASFRPLNDHHHTFIIQSGSPTLVNFFSA